MSLVGDVLPGGRKGLFVGESGRAAVGEGVGETSSGRRRSFVPIFIAVGFSLPASNSGPSEVEFGGVVSMAVDCTSFSASLTGDRLLESAGLSAQPYRDRIE